MAVRASCLRKNYVLLQTNVFICPRLEHCYSSKAAKRAAAAVTATKRIESMGKSLGDRGFLRPNKSYTAPSDAAQKIGAICASLQLPTVADHKLANLEEKFKLLQACSRDFQHAVPNSQIHELKSVGDVIKFYKSSVDSTVPYEALKKMDLPENLHIQYDYVRFHPDTDTKFNGKTAFPKSSTLVTGLKYRNKYEGHEAKRSWP